MVYSMSCSLISAGPSWSEVLMAFVWVSDCLWDNYLRFPTLLSLLAVKLSVLLLLRVNLIASRSFFVFISGDMFGLLVTSLSCFVSESLERALSVAAVLVFSAFFRSSSGTKVLWR